MVFWLNLVLFWVFDSVDFGKWVMLEVELWWLGVFGSRFFLGGVWCWVTLDVVVDFDVGGRLLGDFGVFELEFLLNFRLDVDVLCDWQGIQLD